MLGLKSELEKSRVLKRSPTVPLSKLTLVEFKPGDRVKWQDIVINDSHHTQPHLGPDRAPDLRYEGSEILYFSYPLRFYDRIVVTYIQGSDDIPLVEDWQILFYGLRGLNSTALPACKRVRFFEHSQLNFLDVLISDNDKVREVSFSDFRYLKEIGQLFSLCSVKDVSFHGLSGLEKIGGLFNTCPELSTVNFKGLGGLSSVITFFSECESLKSVEFEGLSSLMRAEVFFTGCMSLQDVSFVGLESLESLSSLFRSSRVPVKLSFEGLSSVTSVGIPLDSKTLKPISYEVICRDYKRRVDSMLPKKPSFVDSDVEDIEDYGYGSLFSYCEIGEISFEGLPALKGVSSLFKDCSVGSVSFTGLTSLEEVGAFFFRCDGIGSVSFSPLIPSLKKVCVFYIDCPHLIDVDFGNIKVTRSLKHQLYRLDN
jgi:hypothetical protein